MQAQDNGSDHLAGANDGYGDDLSFSPEHRFSFSSYAIGSPQTASTPQFFFPGNTFTANSGKLQQNLNTVQSFTEDRQAPGKSHKDESLTGSTDLFWDNLSRSARNSFDQRSTNGSVCIQDMQNCTSSRNTMGRSVFICTREECHGKQFARHSELQRHEDRHNRPFVCPVSSCNKKDFADRGSLQRHSREVHKSAKYFCPIPQCERHKRGFGRKYNLIGHNRRVHRGAASNLLSPVSENEFKKPYLQDEDQAHQSASDEEVLVDEEDDEAESQGDMASPRASSKAERLKQKLRKLRATKNEHDMAGEQLAKDIQNVERLLLDAICEEG